MATGDKLLAVLVLLFMTGVIMGGWWLVLCLPLAFAITFVGLAVYAADRFFKGLRLW